MIYKSLHNKLRIVQHKSLLKYGDKIGWDERVSKYVSTNDTVVVTLLKIYEQGRHEAICTNSSQLYLALKMSHVGVINTRLFKYIQQHTACVTTSNSAPPKTGPDHQNIAEILLKVALDNIILTCSLRNKRRLVPL
jgi:hypothetical protein